MIISMPDSCSALKTHTITKFGDIWRKKVVPPKSHIKSVRNRRKMLQKGEKYTHFNKLLQCPHCRYWDECKSIYIVGFFCIFGLRWRRKPICAYPVAKKRITWKILHLGLLWVRIRVQHMKTHTTSTFIRSFLQLLLLSVEFLSVVLHPRALCEAWRNGPSAVRIG